MQPFKRLLRGLTGLHYPQEYLCLSKETATPSLHVYITEDRKVIQDVTLTHGFVGYHPLILVFAFPFQPPAEIQLLFSPRSFQQNDEFHAKDALARLWLKLIRVQSHGDQQFAYYEGLSGQHHFIPALQRKALGLYNRLYNRKPDNVFLEGNLYDQVQIAYSVPRKISLVTVGSGNLYNLFPTDLHSSIGKGFYIDSLRHAGEAARQVEASGRIVISEMPVRSFREVYSLGKNHMRRPRSRDELAFSPLNSAIFQLPLPAYLLVYRELELIESFTHDIHKLFLFRVLSEKKILDSQTTLAHIHNSFATWAYSKGLAGNYLMR